MGLLLVVAAAVVYAGGGTKTPWPHLFYLPVVMAAGAWGMRAGVGTALAAGLATGPIMPLDVAGGTSQPFGGWLARSLFFVLVAVAVAGNRQRLIRLGDARQQLLSAVSHEVRTPLAAVLGFSQLVLDKYDELTDEECREFAGLINQEATELSNVIDHYVVEGRLEHNLIIETAEVDLRQVVDIVLTGIAKEIRQSRIVVTGDGVRVQADPLRLRQVVRALVNNALAYGGSPIFVLVRQDPRYGTVTISGVRTDWTDSNVSAGAPLGVGLAVARELTELMGGRFIYTVDGTGSLQVHLPVAATVRAQHASRGR